MRELKQLASRSTTTMDNTTIVCWNVRGLNDSARRDNVRTMMRDAHAHVVCLVETKLQSVNQWLIASMLGMNYIDYAYVPVAKCMVAWKTCTRPKKLGGAGNHRPETPGNGIRSKVAVASED